MFDRDDQRTFPVLFSPRNDRASNEPRGDIARGQLPTSIPPGNFYDLVNSSTDDSSISTSSLQSVSSRELRAAHRQLHRQELPSDVSSYSSSTADSRLAPDPSVGAFKLGRHFITNFNIVRVHVKGKHMKREVLVRYKKDADGSNLTRVVPFHKFNDASHELIYSSPHFPQDGYGSIDRVDPQTGTIFYEVQRIVAYEGDTDMILVEWAMTEQSCSLQWIPRTHMDGATVEEIQEEISGYNTSTS